MKAAIKSDKVTAVCPVCNGEFSFLDVTTLNEVRGATCDCSRCGVLLLITQDLEVVEFHKYIHSRDPRWPKDGKGTGYIEV
jgi:hypothetical protein